jgi:7-cyano-7-deazaguanine synthase
MPPGRAVAIVSGGLDSTTMLYWILQYTEKVHVLSFDYGQRHARELGAARAIAEKLKLEYDTIELRSLKPLLKGSALSDPTIPVPEGHYTDENMRITVVPNRNAIMLSIATAAAVVDHADSVWYAAHAGDHAIYPDCRPVFVEAMSRASALGNESFLSPDFRVVSPFLHLTKTDIVALGAELGVPFGITWSCYVGAEKHCGRCATCVERIEAFRLAGVVDPTDYDSAHSIAGEPA